MRLEIEINDDDIVAMATRAAANALRGYDSHGSEIGRAVANAAGLAVVEFVQGGGVDAIVRAKVGDIMERIATEEIEKHARKLVRARIAAGIDPRKVE